jgi:hypothetical protein
MWEETVMEFANDTPSIGRCHRGFFLRYGSKDNVMIWSARGLMCRGRITLKFLCTVPQISTQSFFFVKFGMTTMSVLSYVIVASGLVSSRAPWLQG